MRDLIVWVLKNTPGWNRQEIERVIASRVNTPIKVADDVGVHWVYLTAWSAKDGVVQFRDDIYKTAARSWRCRPISASSRSQARSRDILPQ